MAKSNESFKGFEYDDNGELILPIELLHHHFYWGTRKAIGQKEIREPIKIQFFNLYDIEEGYSILVAGSDDAFGPDEFHNIDPNDLILE